MNKITRNIPDDGFSHYSIEMDWDKFSIIVQEMNIDLLVSEDDMNKRLEEVMAFIDTV